MPKANFTSRWVDSVPTPDNDAQVDYFDNRTTGFGLRLSRKGRKTWFFMYRLGGRLRRQTLGTYPSLSLADARDKAKASSHAVAQGIDPAADQKAERLAETFTELALDYLEKHAKAHKRSWREDERLIRRELLPNWGRRKAKDIKRRDVIQLLDGIKERGAPIQANRVLALARKIYNWAISRDLVEMNPCAQIKAPSKENQRQRVLSEEEIRAVWAAFNQLDLIVGSMFKLRLLTAQRGGEIESMRWGDIDLANGWWTIPGHIAKNGLAHRVPLSRQVLAILNTLYEMTGKGDWVFPSPTRKGQHIANVHKAAQRVRQLSGVSFVMHDLRRTAASHMTSNGIPRDVVGKILNHVEPGVTKVYDRHSYDPEKRQALEAWSNKLEAITSRKTNNIIPIKSHG